MRTYPLGLFEMAVMGGSSWSLVTMILGTAYTPGVLDAKSVCAALKKVFLIGRTGRETGSRVALAGPNWLQKCFADYEASLNF